MSVDGKKAAGLGLRGQPRQEAAPRVEREGGRLALRLAIGKDGLGIELARPAPFACLEIVDLVVRLPQVRFPFDVTGGVARFRHRRGELERIGMTLDMRRLARWVTPKLNGLVGSGPALVRLVPRPFGASVTLTTASDAASAVPGARAPVLAFEIALVPRGDELSLAVWGARSANLAEPPTASAIRAVAAALAPLGASVHREGSAFVLRRAAVEIAGRLLPDAGVRAPDVAGVALESAEVVDSVLSLVFARSGQAPALPEESTRAREAAGLARDGDDAQLRGEPDRARRAHLDALERAPRHPELARRIAEIDHVARGRAEAALATLRDAVLGRGAQDRPRLGSLKAELFVEQGDRTAAVAALLAEAEREPDDQLAAALYARAAELAESPDDALHWLDAAMARAPRRPELRWERAARRLRAGRLDGTRADLQELEALAEGAKPRFRVATRGAHLYREAGLGAQAAELYERALLYLPDDPEALAGLGIALADEGRKPRGAALLAQAIDLAAARVVPTAWMELSLGKILADLGDAPAAIGRLRAVPDDAPEAAVARGLEGRLRKDLGDVSGASLAFARLREVAGTVAAALPWLREAAAFEETRGDAASAQRFILAALAQTPRDAELESESRRLGQKLGAPVAPIAPAAPAAPVVASPIVEARLPLDEAAADQRVEALTRSLQGDPTNDAIIDELTDLLTQLGRGMELLALLSARLEDAPEGRRQELLPRHREVLERLENDARAEGRDGEADLFRMAREAAV